MMNNDELENDELETMVKMKEVLAKKYMKEQRIKENKKRIARGEDPLPEPVVLPGGVEMDPETGKFLNVNA